MSAQIPKNRSGCKKRKTAQSDYSNSGVSLLGTVYKVFRGSAVLRPKKHKWSLSKNALSIAVEISQALISELAGNVLMLLQSSKTKTFDVRAVGLAVRQSLRGELFKVAETQSRTAVANFQKNKTGKQSERAKLLLSVSRVRRFLKQNFTRCRFRIAPEAAVYLTATAEYVLSEIFDSAIYSAEKDKKTRINPRHLMLAVFSDAEVKAIGIFQSAIFAKSGHFTTAAAAASAPPAGAVQTKVAKPAETRKKAAKKQKLLAPVVKKKVDSAPANPIFAARVLTFDEKKKVASALERPAEFSFKGELIDSLPRLAKKRWLNDICINEYLGLLRREALKTPDQYYQTHVFSSYFMSQLVDDAGRYDYSKVKTWSRKVNLFDMDQIMIPINASRNHWSLAVVHLKRKRFEFYDSLGDTGVSYIAALKRYIQDEMKNRKIENIDVDEWKTFAPGENVPQQRNGYDCGIFLLEYARRLFSKNSKFDFDQSEIDDCRQRIVLDLTENAAQF